MYNKSCMLLSLSIPHRRGDKGQSVFFKKKVVNILFMKNFLCILERTINGHNFTTKLVNTKLYYDRYL